MRHKDQVLYVYLSKPSNHYIRALAKKNNLSMSSVVDNLIFNNIDMRRITSKKKKSARRTSRA